MLTNPYETQMVQSLGVKIGPSQATAGAAGAASDGATAGGSSGGSSIAAEAEAGGCPFAGMLGEMEASKDEEILRTASALARLQNIPEFVRPMAKQGVEHYAKTNGHGVVDDEVMEEARGRFGM